MSKRRGCTSSANVAKRACFSLEQFGDSTATFFRERLDKLKDAGKDAINSEISEQSSHKKDAGTN